MNDFTLKLNLFLFYLLGSTLIVAQDAIFLSNPSFEDVPHRGVDHYQTIRGWYDCGQSNFPSESPPDIHPTKDTAWHVTRAAQDGNTYLGMVVRANDSWESVSQAVSGSMLAGNCYEFSIYLSRSSQYVSGTSWNDKTESFTEPAVLRIWGGNSFCDQAELLATSEPVNHANWRQYRFRFEPVRSSRYITLEAFYKTPVLFPYNGNILLDHASEIIEVECDEEEFIADAYVRQQVNKSPIAEAEPDPKPATPPKPEPVKEEVVESRPPPVEKVAVVPEKENKILPDLEREKLEKGQTIRLKNLYFKADSAGFTNQSYDVLDELFDFLLINSDVIIEVGGHTNTLPADDYCDKLSTDRARAVKVYLTDKGIPGEQVTFKGYGKRKPLVPNDKYSKPARQKNQRVEIKILSLTGVLTE